MFSFFKKQPIYRNKREYIKHKLLRGHRLTQLGLYKMVERDGVPEMLSAHLPSAIRDLKRRGVPVKSEKVCEKGVCYSVYFI